MAAPPPSTTKDFEDLINTHFHKGAEVEISSNDEGFRGSWYAGTIIRPIKKSKTTPTNSKSSTNVISNKVLVEYKTLTADEAGRRPLREELDVVQLRPPPPREQKGFGSFKFSEEVDAYYNDGWWEGVITEVLENDRYYVFFRGTREQLEFEKEQLRLHREWVNGKWVPPLEHSTSQQDTGVEKETKVKPSIEAIEEKFSPGNVVEVSSDEEGFQGAWFVATVVKRLDGGKYLIEYKSLRNDDDTEFLKEEVDSLHIRPCPPVTKRVGRFKVSEEVDAFYNDGWWVGEISRVLTLQRYIVYFKPTNEKTEFKHSDLRPHQDWIDGKWVSPSKALKL